MSLNLFSTNVKTNAEEDRPDARVLSGFRQQFTSTAYLAIPPDSEEYKMNHPERGKCLIFNINEFDSCTDLNDITWTNQDSDQLHYCFSKLGFEVIVYKNVSSKELLGHLEKVAVESHSNRDCFVCCILTCGKKGFLYARDGKIGIENVFSPFSGDRSPTLASKPKIFFIQACEKCEVGKSKDEVDAVSTVHTIPTQADFLICYATLPRFYSLTNTSKEPLFVQVLCTMLEKHSNNMDLQSIMTVVNRKLSYIKVPLTSVDKCKDDMQETLCMTSMITRKIYFRTKL
ncbi:caspase-7-like [Tachypleus tridentatus]|uniref:caspase-7-like n=1 Tax=Tachypleus tridentatus TaxID=6853 RepID=UPI003FCFAFBE